MSMLAERKRKTKWILNPTKKPLWTTDSSGIKFGKDLMEKMGWSAGKGLGSKEQGMQEPLKVSYKNDTKGIGFKGNDDDWIEQQDEFNSLLSHLRSSDDTVETSQVTKPEVKSLEHKSKRSRARVHYQKFVRGKDLSKYSDKDLACILGSKAKKEKPEPEGVSATADNCNADYETSFGVTTINSGSIQDYFKKKWTNNKSKCGALPETNEVPNGPNENLPDPKFLSADDMEGNETEDIEEKQCKKKKHKLLAVSNECEATGNFENCSKSTEDDFPQTESEGKKTRKRKNRSNTELESVEIEETCQIDNDKENEKSKASGMGFEEPKRKKKKKNCEDKEINDKEECFHNSETDVITENSNVFEGEEKKSKKKKHKNLVEGEECGGSEINEIEISVEKNERKHKKRNKDKDSSEKKNKIKKKRTLSNESEPKNEGNNLCRNEENFCKEESNLPIQVENEETLEMSGKIGKKRKHKLNLDEIELDLVENEEIEAEQKKKKKKKRKSEDGKEDIQGCETDGLESSRKREKKNKKMNLSEERNDLGKTEEKTTEDSEIILSSENDTNSVKKKKKKKKKEKSEIFEGDEKEAQKQNLNDSSVEISAVTEELKVKKKKEKKEKRRDDENVETDLGEVVRKKKKSKKSEKAEELDNEMPEEEGATAGEGDLGVASEGANGVGEEPLMGKPVDVSEPVQYKSFTKQKVLDLICWADIKEFRGSNLGNVLGYGFKKEFLNCHEVR